MKLLLIVLLLTTGVQAADKLKIAVHEVPPHSCAKCPENGAGVKALRDAFKTEGIELEVVFLPYTRAVQEGSSESYAGYFPEWPNDLPKDKFIPSEPIFESKVSFLHDKSKSFNWKSLSDLKGKKIGGVRGWSYGEEFTALVNNKSIQLDLADDDISNIKKCLAGRIDAAIVDTDLAKALLKTEAKEMKDKINIQSQIVSKFPSVLGLKKDLAGLDEKIKKINASIKKINAFNIHAEYIKVNY